MTVENQQLISGYNEGHISVQEIVHLCRSYQGPKAHLLWERTPNSGCLFGYCLYHLSEAKMFELLQALVNDNPDFPLLRDKYWGSFLDVALTNTRPRPCPTASRRVLILLAVPGTARSSTGRFHPLHNACHTPGIDPAVVHHLIDLDPDVLTEPDNTQEVPLHYALCHNLTAPFVARMVELAPDALLCLDSVGRTPVARAVEYPRIRLDAAQAAVLEGLVRRHPETVVLSSERLQRGRDAPLIKACGGLHAHRNFIKAIVHACPTALAFHGVYWGRNHLLPFEGVSAVDSAAATRALVDKETWELALAVVEYALLGFEDDDTGDETIGEGRGGAVEPGNLGWFVRHVRRTVADFLPTDTGGDTILFSSSGFEVAQALRRTLEDDDANNNSVRRMDLCRALFRGNGDAAGSRRPTPSVRDVLTGNTTITGVYRLNSGDRLKPSVRHQVALLESVKDDLDCLFLHLRAAGNVWVPPPRVEQFGAVETDGRP